MTGDANRRFCEHCQLHVHNLSAMSSREREQFVAESMGRRTCISYEFHPDGSAVTASRWSWLLLPWRRFQWAGAALLAALFPIAFSACRTLGKSGPSCHPPTHADSGQKRPAMLLGEVAPVSPGQTQQ